MNTELYQSIVTRNWYVLKVARNYWYVDAVKTYNTTQHSSMSRT